MDEPNRAIELLREVVSLDQDLEAATVKLQDVPQKTKKALFRWLADKALPENSIQDDVYFGRYFDRERSFYVFAIEATKPKVVSGTVIFENEDYLVGYSFRVPS